MDPTTGYKPVSGHLHSQVPEVWLCTVFAVLHDHADGIDGQNPYPLNSLSLPLSLKDWLYQIHLFFFTAQPTADMQERQHPAGFAHFKESAASSILIGNTI